MDRRVPEEGDGIDLVQGRGAGAEAGGHGGLGEAGEVFHPGIALLLDRHDGLAIDDQISGFSLTASMELKKSNTAHAYFMQQAKSGAIWIRMVRCVERNPQGSNAES